MRMFTDCVVVLMAVFTFGVADVDELENPQDPKPKIEKIEIKKPQQKGDKVIKDVIMILNSEDINKVLVVSTDGEWISDARGTTVTTNIGQPTGKPKVECMMYKGLFKPTKPQIKTWNLENVVTADNVEFQKILDGLQEGKFLLPE